MPTYFDPITHEDIDIDMSATLYLVTVSQYADNPGENTYSIKGISSGLQQLASDPHTHAKQYWPIDIMLLLANERDDRKRLVIFPDNKLTTIPLSVSDVMACLGFNPNDIRAASFNIDVGRVLREEWIQTITEQGIDARRQQFLSDFAHLLHVAVADLLAIDDLILNELLDAFDSVARLVNDVHMPLMDLVALEPPVRAHLLSRSNQVLRLVNQAGIPLARLLALDHPLRKEFCTIGGSVVILKLIKEAHITFDYLSTLTVEELRRVIMDRQAVSRQEASHARSTPRSNGP